ncbi:MAG: Asp-tRNA(Asn)/Glu-tRNA(Gln) amidotransferase subunit GatA [Thiohalomonadaceae bacterium]
MHSKSLAELSAGLTAGSFSSVELTQHFLARITEHDKHLNSFITVTAETALAQAAAADARRSRGEAGALTGIPLAHKDIFCTKDVRTSCASKMLDNFIASYDADVVERCAAAGMVMLGKTNMDEFAMGSSSETSFYGPVKNPWDSAVVPGGSSGGSAAAVAAGITPAATGSDTGGSIRQPAALCGITGVKPTYGRVSRYGMVALAPSLEQAGPMARSAEDCALLLSVMAGFDPRDSTSIEQSVPDYSAALKQDIKGLKIGLPKEYFAAGLNASVDAAVQQAIDEYRKLGATMVEISLPHSELAAAACYVITAAEGSSSLTRMDGVRFGYRCADPQDLTDLYTRSRSEGFGAEVKRRIMFGTHALTAGCYERYFLKAQQVRRLLADGFKQAFSQVDVIMTPTSPTVAFATGERNKDSVNMFMADACTNAANLAGLPAISVPAGFIGKHPLGLQIIGQHFAEERLLNIAHQYQLVTDWHTRAPEGF